MSELGDLLKKLRGKKSLREVAEKADISHNYLSILEKGNDPRSGSPVHPTPETLSALSRAYNYPYDELMSLAGYLPNRKENSQVVAESSTTYLTTNYDLFLERISNEFGLDLHNAADQNKLIEALHIVFKIHGALK